MSPETNKRNNNNTTLEITIVDFNTLNHPEEPIHATKETNLNGIGIFSHILVIITA